MLATNDVIAAARERYKDELYGDSIVLSCETITHEEYREGSSSSETKVCWRLCTESNQYRASIEKVLATGSSLPSLIQQIQEHKDAQ